MKHLAKNFLSKLHREMKLIDYDHSLDEFLAERKPVDLPF
jgi:hypothetical protein